MLHTHHLSHTIVFVAGGAVALCVAGVALSDIHLFAWQEWHLVTSTFALRGRRGTWRHPLAFCVTKLGLGYCRSGWQNWDLVTATCVLRGRRHLAQPLCHIHLSPTIFVRHCLSHNFVTHHLSPTTLSPTIFHTQLCHTPSFTHNLSPTTLSHTICHTPPFTHNFVTHHLSPTTLSHTIFRTQLCHTPSFTQNLSPTTLSHTTCHTTICQG